MLTGAGSFYPAHSRRGEPRNDQAARFINEINYVRTASVNNAGIAVFFRSLPSFDLAAMAAATAAACLVRTLASFTPFALAIDSPLV